MHNDWQTHRLGNLIAIRHGFAFASEHYSDSGQYVLLTPGNFREEGGFRWLGDKQKFYGGPVPTGFVLKPGDMLVAMTEQAPGLLGSTFFVPADATYLHNQRLGAIDLIDHLSLTLDYLHYLLASISLRREISNDAGGTKVRHTSPEKLLSLEVRLPPLPQQRRIADILRTWDEAIERIERLIAAKETRLLRLSGGLLFGGLRLGNRKKRGINKHRWFSVPDDWPYPTICDIAQQVNCANDTRESITVLSCTKHKGLVDSLTYFGRQIFSADTSTYKIVERGQFAYATNHLEEGSIGYLDFCDRGLVSPMYTVFKTDAARVNDRFLLKLFKTSTYLHIFRVNTSASVDRRGGFRWEDFGKIRVPLPDLAEQAQIDSVLSTARREIDLLKGQRDDIDRQKRGLMQKLLTGEWAVPLRNVDIDATAARTVGEVVE
jgi:type I restriction enzyme S subunit